MIFMKTQSNFYLFLIALISAMGGFLFGYDWVVIGGAKPFYEQYFGIANDPVMQGWAMSSALIGCLFGALSAGKLSDRLGRKPILILAAGLFICTAVGTGAVHSLKSIGIDNLRILVGSDGARGITSKVEPTLQTAPGVYNDTILAGLDFLLSEMKKRDMLAVLYLNNSWEWSGGYSQYLEWAGKGKAPVPSIDGWPAFMDYVKEFPNNKKAKSLFADYVKDIITRINRYTNISYVEDPTIMSWQIGNEPRAFSGENKEAFAIWMAEVSRFIKSLDRNHLVSTGSEGKHGCEEDLALFERIHADKHIDYMNIHIWPYNWGWAPADSLSEKAEAAQLQSKQYIDEHLEIAQKYGKPLVLEEFGYPRDGFRFDKSATTQARDTYYQYIFSLITDRTAQSAGLTGCNFWAWGGLAAPKHLYWQRGDDYTGDPAQEQQGLNSVFMSDSTTIAIIRTANQQLKQHSF